jgi:hypothetical protein
LTISRLDFNKPQCQESHGKKRKITRDVKKVRDVPNRSLVGERVIANILVQGRHQQDHGQNGDADSRQNQTWTLKFWDVQAHTYVKNGIVAGLLRRRE